MARILIVDDAKFMRHMLKGILLPGGHEVVAEAENGEKGIEMYDIYSPDIVTMDITMPEMNGIEAARIIISKHPDANIIMCSAMGQQSMVRDAVVAGAKGFVVKPFNDNKILSEIDRILSVAAIR